MVLAVAGAAAAGAAAAAEVAESLNLTKLLISKPLKMFRHSVNPHGEELDTEPFLLSDRNLTPTSPGPVVILAATVPHKFSIYPV